MRWPVPSFSVVIPTRNRADLVVLAARSCLEQDGVDLEVIVVDDGGDDDTEAALAVLPGPLRYVRQEWGGRAVARNHGAKLARADVLAFLDSDDLALPGRFVRQLRRLDRAVAVWGQVEIIDEGGSKLGAETARYQKLVTAGATRGTSPSSSRSRIRSTPARRSSSGRTCSTSSRGSIRRLR